MTLGVRISDLYGTAMIQIEVEKIDKELILNAIKDKWDEVRKQINGIMGGVVVVCLPTVTEYYGKEVARGNILYWGLTGGYRLDLEMKD